MSDRTNELMDLARRVDEKSFAKRVSGLFLILSLDYETKVPSIRTTVRISRSGTTPVPEPVAYVVVDVVRRADSPFADRISVGRADHNDLVIRHATVSKRHACFTRGGVDAWLLTDEGSTNGTWVGGQRLERDAPRPLRGDDVLGFGEVQAAAKNARALWRFLELVRRSA